MNPLLRVAFLIGILLIALTLSFLGTRNGLAEHWAESSQPQGWLRAARLEPGNADYWFRLGQYQQLDFEPGDIPLAIFYYRRAVQVDPHSADNWVALASAYEEADDRAEARQAFEAAKAAYPTSSQVAWRYGNFLLRQNRLPEAFREIRSSIAADPKLAGPAISRCLRASGDMQGTLDQILPAQVVVYLEALSFLVAEQEMDAAVAIWERLVKLRPPLEMRSALSLLERLIEQNRVDQAKRVWQQALVLSGWSNSGSPAALVWDGGFEGDFVNGGFGWRRLPIAGASLDFDTTVAHSGARSLRVMFDGSANLDFAHLAQYVPVEPQTHYHFSAFLRTEKVSTNSGVCFVLFDPHHPAELSGSTSCLVDTHSWIREDLDFTTGPQTRLIEIVLRRYPSQKLDNKIRGTVWVDDVSVAAVSQAEVRSSP